MGVVENLNEDIRKLDEELDRVKAEKKALTAEVEGLKADYATALRRERSTHDQSTRTYKELKQAKAENKDLKAALENIVNPGFGDSLYPMDMVNIAKQTLKERK